jgi:ABC-type Fe3+/spermidine/putrescine transport system ATPase subunit
MADPVDVELEEVSKRFGAVLAVDRVSLEVRRGEFLALLGPSGCGKTTTLRMIAGFEDPDAGLVRIKGIVVNDVPPYRRNLGMVFQHYALFPHMTVFDNVAFGLRMRGTPAAEVGRRVEEALALVRMAGLGKRMPAALSGGQQQRVALARAIVSRPAVLLLDDACAGQHELALQRLDGSLDPALVGRPDEPAKLRAARSPTSSTASASSRWSGGSSAARKSSGEPVRPTSE